MDESLYSVYMQCAANQTCMICFPSIVEMVELSQQSCSWCCIFSPNGLYLPDLSVAKFTKPSRQCQVSFPFRNFPPTSRNFLDSERKSKMKRNIKNHHLCICAPSLLENLSAPPGNVTYIHRVFCAFDCQNKNGSLFCVWYCILKQFLLIMGSLCR